ncbi:MAG: transposase [Deltaproteobacteria bacterium]|nr:transposase [Deltaproteobacteria bacterium]
MKKNKHPGHKALRKGRWSQPNRIYLVTTVTNARRPFFNDLFVGRLVVKEMRRLEYDGIANSLAWVLMPDHLHWLFGLTEKENLSQVIKLLKGRSSHKINQILKRSGYVWEKAFHDHALRKEEDIRQTARYVVANPLRAGLVENIYDYPLWDAIWMEERFQPRAIVADH